MSYLSRDGQYLRLLPQTNLVSFSAPGGTPDRLKVQFELKNIACQGLCQGVSYRMVTHLNGLQYYLNATDGFYLSLNPDPGLLFIPLVSVENAYTFQTFPAQLSSTWGTKQYQFMLEPAETAPKSVSSSCVLL